MSQFPQCFQFEPVQFCVLDQDSRITWRVYGAPHPQVTFFLDGRPLEIGGRYSYKYSLNGECSLHINKFTARDEGIYQLTATNSCGSCQQMARVQLAQAPILLQAPRPLTIMPKQQCRLEACVTGTPAPHVRWYKNWQPLATSDRLRQLELPDGLHVLLLDDCVPLDAGLYTLVATNLAGSVSASAYLHVEQDEALFNYLTYSPARCVKPNSTAFEDFYLTGDEIGRGTQSVVYHVSERGRGRDLAAKCMWCEPDGVWWSDMRHELAISSQLSHHRLARLYGAFESRRRLILLHELCSGGSALDVFSARGSYTERHVMCVIRNVLQALQYMHGKRVAHLGLTPGDIMYDRPGSSEVKLIDFSLSRHINPLRPQRLNYGMPEFVAPEIVNQEVVGLSADMWSVGVISYLLLTGISPFRGATDRETLNNIRSGKLNLDKEAFSGISHEAQDFISKLLVFSSEKRMNVTDALNHSWLSMATNNNGGVREEEKTEQEEEASGEKYHEINAAKLADYYELYKRWMSNASCRDWFRRRALETAFTHPSCMVYPPCEPPPSVRRPPISPPPSCRPSSRHDHQKHTDTVDCSEADRYWRHLVRQQHELHSDEFVSESRYQQGPDTFLLQLQDPGLPARLRHYIKVAGERSQQLTCLLPRDLPFDRSLPAVHERRKFVDIVRERERQQHQRRQLWRTRDSQDCDLQDRQDNNVVVDAGSRGDSVSCHVHDQQHVATQHLTLPAQAAPFIREKPCDVSFRDGSICCLSVVADGAAPLNIQWFRNDLILAESQRVRISDNGVGRCTVTFDPVKQFDQGHYKVVVSNAIGHTQAMCRLFEGCTPAQPLAPTVCDCSSGEVLLRWPPCLDRDLSHDAGATLCYSLQMKQPAEQDWTQVADDIRHEFFVVSNLRPACQYHFRVRASNSVGWSSFSQSSLVHKTRDADSGHRIQLSTCEKHIQLQLHGRQQDDIGDNNDAAHCAVDSWAASVGGRCLDYSVETDRADAAALTVPVLTQSLTNDYHFLSVINRGRFSLVAKCRQTASSQLRAAKILDCSTTEAYNATKYEADMVSSLRHCRLACVLAIHHVHDKYLLVMECLHGLDIVRHLCQRHIYTEDTVAHVISQVLDALEYLHWRRIVHANIQPDNIVSVSCRCVNVKLVDFGCSRQMAPQSPCQHVDTRQHYHNEFAAPELLLMDDGDKSDAAISAASDIWAAVVITYLLLSGCSPFYTVAGDEEVRHNITHVRIKYDRLPAGVTSEAAQFIIAALKMTASDRPSASECLQHRWLSNSDYMIQQRQQLVLHGTQLQEFSERYHGEKTRQALTDNRLGECFGIGDREPVELF